MDRTGWIILTVTMLVAVGYSTLIYFDKGLISAIIVFFTLVIIFFVSMLVSRFTNQ